MNEKRMAPVRQGAKEPDDLLIRRRPDHTTSTCECQQVLAEQLASLSVLIDRQAAATEALERGVSVVLSRLSQTVIEREIHRTLNEAERNWGRR